MPSRHVAICILGPLVIGVFCGVSICHALVHHSSEEGYHLNVPDEWRASPMDVIRQTKAAAEKPGSKDATVYDAAFQPKSNQRWLDGPYVMVSAMLYSSMGISRQISDSEIANFVHQLTGQDVKKLANSAVKPDIGQRLGDAQLGQPQLDGADHEFLLTLEMNVGNEGPVRSLTVGHFGHRALIMVQFVSKAAEWDRLAADRQSINESFRFDPDAAYSVPEATVVGPSSQSIWSGAGKRSLEGAIAGAVLALLGYLATRFRKSKGHSLI